MIMIHIFIEALQLDEVAEEFGVVQICRGVKFKGQSVSRWE